MIGLPKGVLSMLGTAKTADGVKAATCHDCGGPMSMGHLPDDAGGVASFTACCEACNTEVSLSEYNARTAR